MSSFNASSTFSGGSPKVNISGSNESFSSDYENVLGKTYSNSSVQISDLQGDMSNIYSNSSGVNRLASMTKNVSMETFDLSTLAVTPEQTLDVNQTEYNGSMQKENNVWNFIKKCGATLAVGAVSVLSGAGDAVESVIDGGAWVVSKASSMVGDVTGIESFNDFSEKLDEKIAVDVVGNINEDFYSGIGKNIEEESWLKHDSDVAETIRSISKTGTMMVASTLLTPAAGFAKGAYLLGAVSGFGDSAEKTYQEHGTDVSVGREILTGLAGAVNGLSTVALGNSGTRLVNGVKTIAEAGVKASAEIALETLKADGLKILKSASMRTIADIPSAIGAAAAVFKNIAYSAIYGDEPGANAEMWKEIAMIYGASFIGNLFSDVGNRTMSNLENFNTAVLRQGVLDNQAGSIEKYQKQVQNYSKKWNLSEEETMKCLDQKVAQFMNESEVGVRITEKGLLGVLDSGGFKNQFETGTSKGLYSMSSRIEAEMECLGPLKEQWIVTEPYMEWHFLHQMLI